MINPETTNDFQNVKPKNASLESKAEIYFGYLFVSREVNLTLDPTYLFHETPWPGCKIDANKISLENMPRCIPSFIFKDYVKV